MEMPVNEYAICDVGGYQTCAGVGGRSGSGPADCRRDEQPWPWRLNVAGRGLGAVGVERREGDGRPKKLTQAQAR